MGKYTWKDMERLDEKLSAFECYNANHLKVVPGGDNKTIMIVQEKIDKLADGIFKVNTTYIDEFDTYEEVGAFMVGIAWMYYEGVKKDD